MILVAENRKVNMRDVLAHPLGPLPWAPSTCIIDWMSLELNGENRTFTQVAKSALMRVLQEDAQSMRIDVVFDVFRKTSIKDAERVYRGADTTLQHKNLVGGHYVRQWRKFC